MKYNQPGVLLAVAVAGVIIFYYRARKAELAKRDAMLVGIPVSPTGKVLRPDGTPVERLALFGSDVVDLGDFNRNVDRMAAME